MIQGKVRLAGTGRPRASTTVAAAAVAGRQHCVFERTQAEHAPPRLGLRQPRPPERLPIERETASLQKDTESGRHERRRLRHLQVGAALGAHHLAIGERVPQIGKPLGDDGYTEPGPAGMTK